MHSEYSPCSVNTSVLTNARISLERGLQVIAITDHGVRSNPPWLPEYLQAVERARRVYGDSLVILTGMEVDIVDWGRLAVDGGTLAGLDVVVASVHIVPPGVDKAEYWRRSVIRAVNSGRVDVLGHPTDVGFSKLQPPEEYVFEVLDVLRSSGVAVELNYHHRDPDTGFLRAAVERGVMLVPSSDAHEIGEIGRLEWHESLLRAARVPPERVRWLDEARLAGR